VNVSDSASKVCNQNVSVLEKEDRGAIKYTGAEIKCRRNKIKERHRYMCVDGKIWHARQQGETTQSGIVKPRSKLFGVVSLDGFYGSVSQGANLKINLKDNV